jgi:ribosomal protein S18 acetylase RimI-like enzyme
VASWRGAYREHLPAELLDGLDDLQQAKLWRRRLRSSRSPALVADDDGAIVGFASVGPSRDDPALGELYTIYVLPERFGTGVGRELMRAALDRLCELGYAEATLWVIAGNERAERFYRAAGWSREDLFKTEDFGGTPVREVRYRRRLSGGAA